METLLAMTVAIGLLKADAAPPPAPRATVTAERRTVKTAKRPHHPQQPPPSIGF